MSLVQGCCFAFRFVLATCLAGLLVTVAGPAQAKDRWFETPAKRSDAAGKPVNTRESFETPARATQPMFGPATEQNLQAAIRRYEALAAAGGWAPIPPGEGLGPGSVDKRVKLLRARLIITGDLSRSVGTGFKYPPAVVEGAKNFQRRHGLKPTGRVYGSTLQALNIPVQQRLAQLRLNLKRTRSIARQLKGSRYVVVNIPAYELQAIQDGRVALYSRVITGKASTPTPILTAKIRALNFYPHWNVPSSIAARALVPMVMKDRGYLAREHIRVYGGNGEVDTTRVAWSPGKGRSYRFRQDPGPFNALGVVRLDMPNKHTVYMHDTPLQRLFRYGLRPYSAGCVRVHRVLELSEWLTEGKAGWTGRRIRNVVAAGKSETVTFAKPVPVHLVYMTAWGTADGGAQFRVDIYNKDGASRVTAEIEGSAAERNALTP